LLLPEVDVSIAQRTAGPLRVHAMALRLQIRGQPLRVTVSMGVTMLEPPDEPLSQLLHRADPAMYRAKQERRKRVAPGQSRAAWPAVAADGALPADAPA
jgi:diguanylate cyclase (GGDEF)-like protein